jgi:hypothetical protein
MTEKEAVNVADVLKTVRGVPGAVGKAVAGVPGGIGSFALNTARRGANALGDVGVSLTRPGINPSFSPGVNKALWDASQAAKGLGTKTIGALQRGAEKMTGVAHTSKFNPLNMATGAGILGAGAAALTGKSAPPAAAAVAPKVPAASPAAGLGGFSQRATDMWKSLPVEARYAIGAGVPLALLGGYMGRKGGLGGLGLGALGLGAAALGGASGGMFGEGARRFSGKMLYNLGSFFGGKSDTASQLNRLSGLSPELGATVLMGRDPKLSPQEAQQQYEFLTKNKDMISRMLPNLEAKKASAGALLKLARCWKGYEPVPGKAPYSEDSCRPVGSKKKKKEEKKAGSTVFKLTEKKPEAVVDGKKPTSKGHEEKVTRAEPAQSENLRPEEVQPSKS